MKKWLMSGVVLCLTAFVFLSVYSVIFPVYEGIVIDRKRDRILVYTGEESPPRLPLSTMDLEQFSEDLVWFGIRGEEAETGDRVRIRAGSGTEESLPHVKEIRSISIRN
ncbi:DUF3221 domain-containing protein [Alteribacter lacisalsi]|uniref:DUF3221 domain-containing protein n=1 Tax=Alteribacter lacisalsi TaxID=2045244 RepID=UPI001374A32C|nr:DUF3221 domain-containing protein [Alteribacter lacisalsi]